MFAYIAYNLFNLQSIWFVKIEWINLLLFNGYIVFYPIQFVKIGWVFKLCLDGGIGRHIRLKI